MTHGDRPLVKRFEDAKLAGVRKAAHGHEYHFRSNEMAANMATNLVAEWLRSRGEHNLANDVVRGLA